MYIRFFYFNFFAQVSNCSSVGISSRYSFLNLFDCSFFACKLTDRLRVVLSHFVFFRDLPMRLLAAIFILYLSVEIVYAFFFYVDEKMFSTIRVMVS